MINQVSHSLEPNTPKEDNRVTFSDDYLDSDRYLSQFLNVEDLNFDLKLEISDDPIVQIMQTVQLKQTKKAIQKSLKQDDFYKKRSLFHNFQKHLVTTIRSMVDSSKIGICPQTALCQRKLWKIFMNSNKINKTLVSIVVGDLTTESSNKVAEYGFLEICELFSCDKIKKAQKNLHQNVLCQLREAKLEDQLAKRRMKHKEQFMIYFQAFLEELESRNLQKRMAKCTKLMRDKYL